MCTWIQGEKWVPGERFTGTWIANNPCQLGTWWSWHCGRKGAGGKEGASSTMSLTLSLPRYFLVATTRGQTLTKWIKHSCRGKKKHTQTHNTWTPHESSGRTRIPCLCFYISVYINTSQRFYFEISAVLQLTEAFHLVLSLKMSVILKYLGKFS